MDDEVSLDVGMAVSESLLEHFGFEKFRFQPDDKKSKYYIPGTQTEVYGYHPKLREWVEVATFGMYSPIALAKYGIDKDVMNLGVGAERIAMVNSYIRCCDIFYYVCLCVNRTPVICRVHSCKFEFSCIFEGY